MRRATVLIATALVLLGAGCSRKETRAGDRGTSVGRLETVTSVDRALSGMDGDLTAQIRRLVASDPQLSASANDIRVSAVGGVVTLRGLVSTVDQRDAVASKAGQVAGVRKVENVLEVVGEPPEGDPDTE